MGRFREAFDEAAFDELIARYHRPALLIARNHLSGQNSSAEDAVQEAFIRTVRSRDRFDVERSFASWFYSILRNVCLDFRRKEVRRARQLQEIEAQDKRTAQDRGPDRDTAAMLQSLPPADRDILIYRFVHGMTFQEIAAQVGASVEATKKRAQRALKQLRTKAPPEDLD